MGSKRKEIIAKNKVSELYDWTLGGYDQKVLVEGREASLPVVITLHGGPGTPMPFSVGCRGLFPEFTDRFLMVYWDQLGCGINNYVIDDSFTIDSFVQMTIDLVGKVKETFPHNKIYIFAASWGSVLSAKILEKDGNIVDGVIVWGQIVKEVFFNEEVTAALENTRLPKAKLETIRKTQRDNASPKELQLVSASIRKYTSGYVNKAGAQAPMGPIVKGLLTSPDYRFRDFKAILVNGYRKNRSLWKEILKVDLRKTLENVEIPYLILQGDTDIVASTSTVCMLVENSNNPNLKCKMIDHSGHMPGKEGMDRLLEELCLLEKRNPLPVTVGMDCGENE